MKQVTIYSRQGCAPCNQLKQFMKLKGLSYVEKSVDNPDNAAEAYGYAGMSIVPVTVVENNNTKQVISGYNPAQLMPALV